MSVLWHPVEHSWSNLWQGTQKGSSSQTVRVGLNWRLLTFRCHNFQTANRLFMQKDSYESRHSRPYEGAWIASIGQWWEEKSAFKFMRCHKLPCSMLGHFESFHLSLNFSSFVFHLACNFRLIQLCFDCKAFLKVCIGPTMKSSWDIVTRLSLTPYVCDSSYLSLALAQPGWCSRNHFGLVRWCCLS